MATKSYPLTPSEKSNLRCGDFAAIVQPNALEVPREMWQVATKLAIRDAAELISFTFTFPSALASEFGWSTSDLTIARDRLAKQLKGVIPDTALQPPVAVRRSYGALPPNMKDLPGG